MHEEVKIGFRQNDCWELKHIWDNWDRNMKEAFTKKYGDIAVLLRVQLDDGWLQAVAQLWNPTYRCFTFNQQDLVPTIDEYTALLNIERAKFDWIYCKALSLPLFKKRLRQILGAIEAWVDSHIKVKGSSECISWANLNEAMANIFDQKKV